MTAMTLKWTMTVCLLGSFLTVAQAWTPQSMTMTTRRTSLALMSTRNNNNNNEVAHAWTDMDDAMCRNDRAALKVLQELRASLKCLETVVDMDEQQQPATLPTTTIMPRMAKSADKELARMTQAVVQTLESTDPITIQTDPIALSKLQSLSRSFHAVLLGQQEEDARKLVAHLACNEAQEHATRQSRIEQAREEGYSHSLMQARYDQQKVQFAPPPTTATSTRMLRGQDDAKTGQDDASRRLVALLASRDAQQDQVRSARIDKAKQDSWHMIMTQKMDLQQQHAAKAPPPVVPPLSMMDPAASALVAQLAALEAQEAFVRESRIQHAKDDSQHVTMQAKWDMIMSQQQQQPIAPIVKHGGLPMLVPDEPAAQLVSLLAAREASEWMTRQARIEKAKDQSLMDMMHDKIQNQMMNLQQPEQQPLQLHVPSKIVISYKDTAIRNNQQDNEEDVDAEYQEELFQAVLETSESVLAQETEDNDDIMELQEDATYQAELLNAVLEASDTLLVDETASNAVSSFKKQPIYVQAADIMDQETADLVAHLAAREAQEYSIQQGRIQNAKDHSSFVTMNAKLDQQMVQWLPDVPLVQQKSQFQPLAWDEDAAQLVAQLASREAMEHETKSSRIQNAKDVSEFVMMQGRMDQQAAASSAAAVPPVSIDKKKQKTKDKTMEDAAALVAQLAAQEAAEVAAKDQMIRSALEASQFAAQQAKLDQQQQESNAAMEAAAAARLEASKPDKVFTDLSSVMDDETASLVAQLATKEAQQLSAKETIIKAAREESEEAVREAKLYEQTMREIHQTTSVSSSSGDDNDMKGMLEVVEPEEFHRQIKTARETAAQALAEIAALRNASAQALTEISYLRNATVSRSTPPPFFFASVGTNGNKNVATNGNKNVPANKQKEKKQGPGKKNKRKNKALNKGVEQEIEIVSMGQDMAAKENDEIQMELKELFSDVSVGFKEVKKSLVKLISGNATSSGEDGEWGDFSA